MTDVAVAFRRDLWIPLDRGEVPVTEGLAALQARETGTGPSAAGMAGIVARARTMPTIAETAERFLLVGDGSWHVLELTVGDTATDKPLDPATDLPGRSVEELELANGLRGHRLVTMESAGVIEGLLGAPSELLFPHLHYFLANSGDGIWVYAGILVPDPAFLPAVSRVSEELLAGIEQG